MQDMTRFPDEPVAGVPLDATGLTAAPLMPAPNNSKKAKAKATTMKLIRYGRRIVLRKQILIVPLGRQLSGPVAALLKQVSRDIPIDSVIEATDDLVAAPPLPLPGLV
jgi:hypothetical protein